MKSICFVTSCRSDFGLLRRLMKEVQQSKVLKLQIIATGSHLLKAFGNTYLEIQDDGFTIDFKVDMPLNSDKSVDISNSIGYAFKGIGEALEALSPDTLILLGDRYEIAAFAIVANIHRIPLVHLHGGEVTEGAFDESFRHAITKLSHLHFVATETYKKRVCQLGENPKNVYNYGGLGVDSIANEKLIDKETLEYDLGLNFDVKTFLVTFHPTTLEKYQANFQITELLDALTNFRDFNIVFTMPNSDPEHLTIKKKIDLFCKSNKLAKSYNSLGHLRYLSCMKYSTAVIGNSSSGILEAPAFKIGTINIGNRQKGRVMSKSIINCSNESKAISKSINTLLSRKFQESMLDLKNPYGTGGASKKILKVLEKTDYSSLLKKPFFDLI